MTHGVPLPPTPEWLDHCVERLEAFCGYSAELREGSSAYVVGEILEAEQLNQLPTQFDEAVQVAYAWARGRERGALDALLGKLQALQQTRGSNLP